MTQDILADELIKFQYWFNLRNAPNEIDTTDIEDYLNQRADKQVEILSKFNNWANNMEGLDPEIAEIVNKNFWKLLY